MRGRVVVDRARLAGKEQPFVNRRGQHAARIGVTRPRVGIGAERIGVATPCRADDRAKLLAYVVAEMRRDLIDRITREGVGAFALEVPREAAAEIALDHGAAERPQVIAAGAELVGLSEQPSLGRKVLRLVE